jgi:hypothetical protein
MSYASLLPASLRRTGQVIFAPFVHQAPERGFECLQERDHLRLKHSAIFFSWMHPHAAAFNCCIQHCLVQAGNKVISGSTKSVAASAALACGASLGDVLRLGDWSNASTYFRFYHAL